MDTEKSISSNPIFPMQVNLTTDCFMEKTVFMKPPCTPTLEISKMQKKMEKECCWKKQLYCKIPKILKNYRGTKATGNLTNFNHFQQRQHQSDQLFFSHYQLTKLKFIKKMNKHQVYKFLLFLL